MRTRIVTALIGAGSLLANGCGGRADAWDTPVSPVAVGELKSAVVLVDGNLNRALILRAGADQTLGITAVPLGKRVISTTTSPDRKRVFVLSQGEEERLRTTDEGPALTVFDTDQPDAPRRYPLPGEATSLLIDPTGKYAVLYAGDSPTGSFLSNPNELFFIDLTPGVEPGPDNPHPRTLPSKAGGAPKRLTFTPELEFPDGDPRRFLVVETDRDLLLLDLAHPERGEITLPLTNVRADPRPLSPAGIAIDPGSVKVGSERPPRIAIRTNTDDSVLFFTLEHTSEPTPGGNDFVVNSNLAPVGGVPSDIAFVQTKQGPRLAAVVPAPTPRALLIKADDNQALTATFSQSYQKLSLVTGLVSNASPDGDQVMLWANNGGAASVALWDLGAVPTAAQADIDTVKSVETINLDGAVTSVTDVLDERFQNLKVLQTTSRKLYVLDLDQHQARPLNVRGNGAANVVLGLLDDRAWAYEPAQTDFGRIRLTDAHSENVLFKQPIDRLLEITRADGSSNAVLTFHNLNAAAPVPGQPSNRGTLGVTVFDAEKPDVPTSRRYSSVTLERLAQ